jgi:sulfide:quinone oxidoreductase
MAHSAPAALRPLRVVVAGGGVPGLEELLALRALTGDALALTLVTPDDRLDYRPLTALEPFSARATRRYDLGAICADLGVARRRDELAAVASAERAIVTQDGERIAYDALVLACRAHARPALPHAHTLLAEDDPRRLRWILRELETGTTRRIAFVVPPGHGWPLPLYELALTSAARARELGVDAPQLTLVTPEAAPLALFQGAGSAAVGERLARAGIAFVGGSYAHDYDGRTLTLTPGERTLAAERVVALPALSGPAIEGVPSDAEGFLYADEHGRVPGLDDVYAIGEATTFGIGQVGVAAQRADLVATLIARSAGARVAEPSTRPLLRAVLSGGDGPLYLRASVAGGAGHSTASRQCPWWPPHKVAARYLAPYLADRDELPDAGRTGALPHAS